MVNSLDYDLMKSLISKMKLDLSGLTVYTEAASGPYSLCPIMALLSGADYVYAQTRDSRYATAVEVVSTTLDLAKAYGVSERLSVLKERDHDALSKANIVTNSNFVRPIDRDLISRLHEKAVIPLMWETWEFRPEDFNLDYCKEKGILSLGTIEHKEPVDMRPYTGLLALRMLFEIGYNCGKVLLIGDPPSFALPMLDYMRRIEIDVVWAGKNDLADISYDSLSEYFKRCGADFSVMLIADQESSTDLIGANGIISFNSILNANSNIRIGVVSGGLDEQALKNSGIRYLPGVLMPPRFMSYQPYLLGNKPVLTLYAGGLRVGEVMARSRIKGMSLRESAIEAIENSPAIDFVGDLAWI